MSGSKKRLMNTLNGGVENWSFERGFEEFLKYCELKNLRPKTIKNYEENYSRFVYYLKNCTLCSTTDEINQSIMNEFIIYLKGTGMLATSVNTYLRGIRAICNFLIDNQHCTPLKIHMLKTDKATKETYSDQELYKLLVKPSLVSSSFTEYRNWCIINFFIATGVRASTLINIKNNDLDFEFDRMHLEYTKNRHSHIIPMSMQIKSILMEYKAIRKGTEEDYLFCNQYGGQLSLDGLKHAIAKYNQKRNVFKTSLHAFRHTFAKKAVLNGMNVFALQKWLGHSDISVTQVYVDLYADDLAIDLESINPLDTLGKPKKDVQQVKKRKKLTISL